MVPDTGCLGCAANATQLDLEPITTLGRHALAPAGAADVSTLPGLWQPTPSLALWPSEAPLAREAAVRPECHERFAPAAPQPVDPFGIHDLLDLWPANSTELVKPRPWPVGPAYNSSDFSVFINTTYVVLVRLYECTVR